MAPRRSIRLLPGVFLVLLTISSIVFATIPEPTTAQRVTWIAVFALLGIGEVWITYRDRFRHDQDMARLMATHEAARQDALAQFRIIYRGVSNLMKLSKLAPAETLQRRVLELSQELIAFAERWFDSAPEAKAQGRITRYRLLLGEELTKEEQEDWIARTEHDKAMMQKYSDTYATRVVAIRNELASSGVTDAELEKLYKQPKSVIQIMRVADRLGEMATHVIPAD